jgi:hypothetical protein
MVGCRKLHRTVKLVNASVGRYIALRGASSVCPFNGQFLRCMFHEDASSSCGRDQATVSLRHCQDPRQLSGTRQSLFSTPCRLEQSSSFISRTMARFQLSKNISRKIRPARPKSRIFSIRSRPFPCGGGLVGRKIGTHMSQLDPTLPTMR